MTGGSPASFIANLTPQDIYTGNVALSVSGLPAQATATFTPAIVNGGSGSSTLNITNAFPAGSYPLTIQGAVSNLNHPSSVTLIVGKASSVTAVPSSSNPSELGEPLTFTASLSSPTVASPLQTGTIQFKDGAANIGSPVAVSNGSASFTTPSLSVGPHSITAVYSGDTNFFGSASSVLSQAIVRHSTATAVNSSSNPSSAGQSVTLIATVSQPSATGTIDFHEGNNILGSGTLSGGIASFATSTLPAGPHNITANYQGDINFFLSVSPVLTQVVMTAGTGTATKTQFSNPPSTFYFHQRTPISFSIVVATNPASGNTPQGSVIFLDGNAQLGEVPLDAGGSASYTPPPSSGLLRHGAHTIRAVYVGSNGSFDGSADAKTLNSSPRPKPR